MIIILIGVSGSGKTTIGGLLAKALGWPFYDGDDFHPRENIEKMASGIPLTDDDRSPWLERIRSLIEECRRTYADAVVACSALRRSYRIYLSRDVKDIRFVYLKGDFETVLDRIGKRSRHFLKR